MLKRCLYCGRNDSKWSLSSSGTNCLDSECRTKRQNGVKPISELLSKFNEDCEHLAREWCDKNGMNYDEIMREQHVGDM